MIDRYEEVNIDLCADAIAEAAASVFNRYSFIGGALNDSVAQSAHDSVVRANAAILSGEGTAAKNCTDCKGSGWYVGLVERRPCPSCRG